ncbi:MAG: hypothetical protein IT372_26735 [Polyangiaceae bacterium]|nr:hypothetical protein [Polyangiaceae bacterium]
MNQRTTQILHTSTKAAGLAALALVALGPLAAHAENQMNPGSMCVSGTPTNAADIDAYGQARNSSSSSMTLVCPVVRAELGPLAALSAKVFVTDNHYTQDVCCSARTKNAGQSNSLFVSAEDCTPANSTGANMSLDMFVAGGGGTWDYHFIMCPLPPTYSGNASVIQGFRGIGM